MTGNLIPITALRPEDAKAQAIKGGKATKGIKRMSTRTCYSCKLPCPLKEQGSIERWRCKVPDTQRLILEVATDPKKLLDSTLADLMQLQLMAKTHHERAENVRLKLDLKQKHFPAVQEVRQDTRMVTFETIDLCVREVEAERVEEAKRKAKNGGQP